MDKIDSIYSTALDRYFELLTKVGYSSLQNIDNLLVIDCIQLLTKEYYLFITDADLKSILNAVYCIAGNCLIDYPNVITSDSLYNELRTELNLRLTEDEITRITESGIVRKLL